MYHSSRYVKDDLVIRLKRPISQRDVERLTEEFKVLIRPSPVPGGATGGKPVMMLRDALPEEDDNLELPRLVFPHTRYKFGLIRILIDRINECEPV
jgi:hypothetical protein